MSLKEGHLGATLPANFGYGIGTYITVPRKHLIIRPGKLGVNLGVRALFPDKIGNAYVTHAIEVYLLNATNWLSDGSHTTPQWLFRAYYFYYFLEDGKLTLKQAPLIPTPEIPITSGDSIYVSARRVGAQWTAFFSRGAQEVTLPIPGFDNLLAPVYSISFEGWHDAVTEPLEFRFVGEYLAPVPPAKVGQIVKGLLPYGGSPSLVAEFRQADSCLVIKNLDR